MKKIAIIGYGYVGKAMVEMLKKHYQVLVYDPNNTYDINSEIIFVNDIKNINNHKCELAFVCVPTEMKDDRKCDTSIVEDVVKELEAEVIVIKSTVPPGTTDRLGKETGKRICFSSEYIGESTYWSQYSWDKKMDDTPWFIFGGNKEETKYVIDILAPILGPTKEYCQTDAKTVELVKYWENTFYAMKVTFCNEMYEICEKMNINYWEARELWLKDPRVNKMHTAVFKDKRGYGGKCYPKDTNGLVMASKEAGYVPQLLEAMIDSNKRFKSKNI